MARKNNNDEIRINPALLNVIMPQGLEFKRNSLVIGEHTGKIYGVIKYPAKVDYGWLSKITNMQDTIVSITFRPIDNGSFVQNLSSAIRMNRGTAEAAKDPLVQKRAEKAAEDGEKILVQIDQYGETVGVMGIEIMALGSNDEKLEKASRRVESTAGVLGCKARNIASMTDKFFKGLSPFYPLEEDVESIVGRIVPLSTFVGGFPFSSTGLNDGSGYMLGKDPSGGLVVTDIWRRSGDRTNSNIVCMGLPGVGKSTAIKSLAISEFMSGTTIVFVDPEREYKDLCHNLEGDWINAGGGGNGKINPLEIRKAAVDDVNDIEDMEPEHGMGDLALHMKTLEVFLELYLKSLNDRSVALLKKAIIDLYEKWNITWNTDVSKLGHDDFPTFEDLYKMLDDKGKSDKEYEDLALLFRDIAIGSDSFIWNGKTTINPRTNCIVFDTHDLMGSPDNVKRAQYFNILTYCWELMSKDRSQRVMLFCDEAYLLIDPQIPQSLIFVRNIAKRCRKYEAAIAVISHSVVDFLDPQVKMYGQAILDSACYKILMGCDGKNLEETKNLYALTEAEEELMLSKRRGHALFMAGSKRLHIEFEIPEYKFRYMGAAGGR
jgi:uncharacterized protein YuzE